MIENQYLLYSGEKTAAVSPSPPVDAQSIMLYTEDCSIMEALCEERKTKAKTRE
jgi:hypothetical protein